MRVCVCVRARWTVIWTYAIRILSEYASELTATKTIHVSIYQISIWKGWTTEKAGQMDIRLLRHFGNNWIWKIHDSVTDSSAL